MESQVKLRALMSIPSAARYLGMSPRTFLRAAESRETPLIEIKGQQYSAYFIRKEDLLNFQTSRPKVKHQWDRAKLGPKKEHHYGD